MKKDEIKNQIDKLCKDNNYEIAYKFDFPIYRILPEEVRLATSVLEKHGLVVRLELKEKK